MPETGPVVAASKVYYIKIDYCSTVFCSVTINLRVFRPSYSSLLSLVVHRALVSNEVRNLL